MAKKKVIIKKRKVLDPIKFTGKVIRELTEDPKFTLQDFKNRYGIKKK